MHPVRAKTRRLVTGTSSHTAVTGTACDSRPGRRGDVPAPRACAPFQDINARAARVRQDAAPEGPQLEPQRQDAGVAVKTQGFQAEESPVLHTGSHRPSVTSKGVRIIFCPL